MNNEEAEVKVTQEIPLITGSYAGTTAAVGGTTSPFQTIQREEVGTILKVTPHISEGDTIQLKVEQEDSSPGAKLANSADISTNKRAIKTTILIQDGGIIVLGGLMQDTVNESEDRVPVLGAIPLHRQSVQVTQRLAPERATCWSSCGRGSCAISRAPKRSARRNTTRFAKKSALCTMARSGCCPARSSRRFRRCRPAARARHHRSAG